MVDLAELSVLKIPQNPEIQGTVSQQPDEGETWNFVGIIPSMGTTFLPSYIKIADGHGKKCENLFDLAWNDPMVMETCGFF
ncbi:MAG: hypothetical protein GY679_00845 [Mycoplasma sp.]|nr:hypothetical protein [Mycoplasma sp.]